MASTPTDGERIPLILVHGAWLSALSWAAIDSWLVGVLAPEAASQSVSA